MGSRVKAGSARIGTCRLGIAGHGMAGPGRHRTSCPGLAWPFLAWLGRRGQSASRLRGAWRGASRQARLGKARLWPGGAGRVWARLVAAGWASWGMSRRVAAGCLGKVQRVVAVAGSVWDGWARHGKAGPSWLGSAGTIMARQACRVPAAKRSGGMSGRGRLGPPGRSWRVSSWLVKAGMAEVGMAWYVWTRLGRLGADARLVPAFPGTSRPGRRGLLVACRRGPSGPVSAGTASVAWPGASGGARRGRHRRSRHGLAW